VNRFRSIWRTLIFLSAVVSCWSVTALVAWAKAQPEAAAPKTKNWVLGYALVVLGIALGLVVICRPGRRTTELGPRQEE